MRIQHHELPVEGQALIYVPRQQAWLPLHSTVSEFVHRFAGQDAIVVKKEGVWLVSIPVPAVGFVTIRVKEVEQR